jgi:transposase-like protein
MGRVSQPVLPMLPAQARSIGASAGLLEGPDGGVVFVFGLATFGYAASDETGRRLAAVQLVASKIATSLEVSSAFGVSGVTLWKWRRDYTCAGVAGLMRARTGPKGPIKLTQALAARIVELDATGLTLLQIAAQAGVSTATVRVALGRVGPVAEPTLEPKPGSEVVGDAIVASPDQDDEMDEDHTDLVVLAAPVPRIAERVAARFGDLREAPGYPSQGCCWPCRRWR